MDLLIMIYSDQKFTYQIPLVLQRDEITLHGGLCLSCQPYDMLISTHHDFLHANEKKYFNNIAHKKRQYSYLLGRYCAKYAISALTFSNKHTNVLVEPGIFQQPIIYSLEYPNLQVSISHTENIGAAVAFPEAHPMGIDIEKITPDKEKEMLSLTTTAERKLIGSLSINITSHLALIWTAKEALSKAIRCGFMVSFAMLETQEIMIEGDLIRTYFKHLGQYQALSFLMDHYVCSIVLPRKSNLNLNISKIKNSLI
jgi:4'-phosphopantetheinyl transferase